MTSRILPIAGVVASLLFTYPTSSIADANKKAPAGSQDNAIRTLGFCIGQASARAPRLTEAFKKANTDSAVYLTGKMLFVGNQLQWMYTAIVAVGNAVENPDPKILTDSKSIGEKKGAALFDIEDNCLRTCSTVGVGKELRTCVDSCTEQEDPKLHALIKECDSIYARASHPQNSGASGR